MQFRRQMFSPQTTFFKDLSTQQLTQPNTFFLHQFISMVVQVRMLLFLTVSNVSELKRKNALLFQLFFCQVSGRLLHEMYKVVKIIHVQVHVLKILCLSFYLLQGCSVKVSERAEMCKSSIFIWPSPFMAGEVCGWEKGCLTKMGAGWKMQMNS